MILKVFCSPESLYVNVTGYAAMISSDLVVFESLVRPECHSAYRAVIMHIYCRPKCSDSLVVRWRVSRIKVRENGRKELWWKKRGRRGQVNPK